MPQYHVYGVGNALVDMEFEIADDTLTQLGVDKGLMTLIEEDRHDELLSKLDLSKARQCSGGSAANTIIATAQLGANSFYSCKVANDDTGDFYMKDLTTAGVTSNLSMSTREDGVTGKCIVLITPDAERSMNTHLGITQRISTRELNEAAIRDSEYVYIEGYLVPEAEARAAAIKTREVAEAAGVKTAITLSDVNMVQFFKAGMEAMIGNGVDLLFCNEEEALLMTNAADVSAALPALQKIAKQFAITRGARGAVLFDGSRMLEIPAQTVRPVDSNGAGDIYAGSFLYGLTHGLSFVDSGKLAGAAATELVQHFGARLPSDTLQAIGAKFKAG